MTQPGYRHRIIIQDRSGSMLDILTGAQSGLREFFESEASVPGKATYSLWDFNDRAKCVYSFAPVDAVRGYEIVPDGTTAMYDAIGKAVTAEGERLAELAEDERPEDVTVIIASDGLNNASVKYTGTQIRDMLQHQQDVYAWRVIYMGTNQDAFKESASMGVHRNTTISYVNTNTGTNSTWRSAASFLTRAPIASAAPQNAGYSFTQEEREQAEGTGSQ